MVQVRVCHHVRKSLTLSLSCLFLPLLMSYDHFFFYCYGDYRDLHVLTHAFPTPRSSDLIPDGWACRWRNSAIAAGSARRAHALLRRSEEHTSELQSLMRISYAVFCLKKKKINMKQEKGELDVRAIFIYIQ